MEAMGFEPMSARNKMEQGTGVAPVTPAWKAGVLLLN